MLTRYWFRLTAPGLHFARWNTPAPGSGQPAGETSIVVLNVQAPLPPSRYVTRSMIRQHHSSMSLAALRLARSTARRLKLGAHFYVRKGDPATTVARFAKTMRCSEIVMGTRGRGRTAVFVLGSVALRVVQLAEAPVTLVK